MNEQLQKEITQWLMSLRDQIDNGVNFAIEQAPLVVQDKVRLGRIEETIYLLFFLVLLVVGAVTIAKLIPAYQREDWPKDRDGDLAFPYRTLYAVPAVVVGTIGTCVQAHSTITVWFAPRIYILEWLRGLLS